MPFAEADDDDVLSEDVKRAMSHGNDKAVQSDALARLWRSNPF